MKASRIVQFRNFIFSPLLIFALIFFCSIININQASDKRKLNNELHLLLQKGKQLKKIFPDSSIYYYQQGLKLIESVTDKNKNYQINFTKIKFQANIGQIFHQQSKYSFATEYFRKALKDAEILKHDSLIAECNFNLGEICLENGNYASAVDSYTKAIILFKKMSNSEGIFWTNVGLGIVFRELGNTELSKKHYEDAKAIGEKENNKFYIATSNNNIGNLYNQIGEYETAIEYLMASLKSFKEYGNEKFVSDCYESIGSVYVELGNYERAIDYFNKSTKIVEVLNDRYRLFSRYANLAQSYSATGNNESALMYFSKTLELAQSIGDKARLSEILIMLSKFYIKNNDFKNAHLHLNKSLMTSSQIGDTVSIVSALNSLSELSYLQKKYNEAENYAIDAYNIAHKKDLLKVSSESSFNLSKIYKELGNYKEAYRFGNIHKQLNDSLFNSEKIKILEDTEAKYKLEQLETENKKVINEAFISETQLQNRNLLVIILGVLIIVSLFLFGNYFFKKRTEKREQKEKAQQLTRQIDLLNSQLNLKNRELTGKALMISSNNKVLSEVIDSLNLYLNNENGNKKELRKLKGKLQNITEEESWGDFLQHFEEVHPKFYNNLTENYTNLSASEQKICAFLKMKLNTKEIAQVTNSSVKSVEVARTRIRKKLNIEHCESLTKAIQKI